MVSARFPLATDFEIPPQLSGTLWTTTQNMINLVGLIGCIYSAKQICDRAALSTLDHPADLHHANHEVEMGKEP